MPRFVIQHHLSRSPHFDVRLERDGVFKSWAVPKGLSEDTGTQRLALAVDDHTIEFGDFEGVIPVDQPGAGPISVWDSGSYDCIEWSDNRIVVVLHGGRLQGTYEMHPFPQKGPREWLVTRIEDVSPSQ